MARFWFNGGLFACGHGNLKNAQRAADLSIKNNCVLQLHVLIWTSLLKHLSMGSISTVHFPCCGCSHGDWSIADSKDWSDELSNLTNPCSPAKGDHFQVWLKEAFGFLRHLVFQVCCTRHKLFQDHHVESSPHLRCLGS